MNGHPYKLLPYTDLYLYTALLQAGKCLQELFLLQIKRMMDEYQYGSPKRFDPNSRLLARKVDKVARKLFPTFFALFNLAYWCVFLLQ